jgi:NAD(P)-dependent dehydrogenase (short-subunit alcohol dehydrogenase family)
MADLPVDVLVNNAGGATDVSFEDIRDHEWDRDVDLCLKGRFLCTQAVLPAMLRRGHGAMVNVVSVNGLAHFRNEAYSAAKAGVLSLTRDIAARYGPYGVRCNARTAGHRSRPPARHSLRRPRGIPVVRHRSRRSRRG